MEKEAYSIDELAEVGPLGRTYLFQAIKEKRLIARKAGRRTIITREDYKSFLENLPKRTDVQSQRTRGGK